MVDVIVLFKDMLYEEVCYLGFMVNINCEDFIKFECVEYIVGIDVVWKVMNSGVCYGGDCRSKCLCVVKDCEVVEEGKGVIFNLSVEVVELIGFFYCVF